MALVKLIDGRGVDLPEDKGHAIWQVLQGQREPTVEQGKFCDKVYKVYLNWHNAPDDYILDRLETLRYMYRGTDQSAELAQRVRAIKRG